MKAYALPLIALFGCGAPHQKPDGGVDAGPGTFIALQTDFAGYTQWRAFDLGYSTGDSAHFGGHRVVYLKQAPPHGATEWPIGTLLVKEVTPDAGELHQIFGMAKRGGGFNPDGAVDWEWFQLAPDTNPPFFLWRGAQPPPAAYGNDDPNSCDGCHGTAAANDFVLGAPLLLSDF